MSGVAFYIMCHSSSPNSHSDSHWWSCSTPHKEMLTHSHCPNYFQNYIVLADRSEGGF